MDITDLVLVARVFGSVLGGLRDDSRSDLNNDGIINIVDPVIVASYFGQKC